jgi:hypothetical protein
MEEIDFNRHLFTLQTKMKSSSEDLSKLKILLTKINEELRQDWLKEEFNLGKNIELKWVWIDVAQKAIEHYKSKGWIIKKTAVLDGSTNRKLILNFKNPKWNLDF